VSLFLRIFLSFWLAMLLLGGSLILLSRFYGGEVVERSAAVLQVKAETAALLWRQGGAPVLRRWLRLSPDNRSLVLVNSRGEPQMPAPLPRHLQHWLPRPVVPGVERIGEGHLMLAEALPEVTPPLYLVMALDPGRLHGLPIWLRGGLAVLIFGLVSLLLARMLTRQVRPLRQAVQRMTEGDLSGRVKLTGRDEISALGRDFNRMAERLNDLLQSQRQLVRDVSHELRSPLARLRVALELAERAEAPEKALGRIEKEADELERLITDMLSLARLESGQSGLERQPLALDELVALVVKDADFEARARGKRVFLLGSTGAPVEGDPVLLRAAVENVVRNAIRHTPEGGGVEVALEAVGDRWQVSVTDAGPGVPEAQLQTIFEPFARPSQARERGSGGFGLGLAIARRAMLAHGGGIEAANQAGGGLRVRLYLPREGA